MYTASEAFHTAITNGAHQMALLIFDDAVFTNDDINVSNGITFNEYFNTEEDLAIGQALSNEISFSLFNDDRLLNNYEFGDFIATIGVMTNNEEASRSYPYLSTGSHVYTVQASSPYLLRDGAALESPPSRRPDSLLYYKGILYTRLTNGTIMFYDDNTGAKINGMSMNDFMKAKMIRWSGKGIAFRNNTLNIWATNFNKTYEFVPLGLFTAERPNVPDEIEIQFTCYDMMQKFDIDMPSSTALNLTYPTTFYNLFTKMCNYVGVAYSAESFINSTATLSSEPDEFGSSTMRDVLKWIAEAAGSVVRFSRDGVLKMDWLHQTSVEIDENGYSEFRPYWYATKKVTKLYNRASDGSYSSTVGTGTEGYLIQDNPLLKGVT